ncbi:MAG: lysoplasmalogenase [Anaerolineales bacterium]
MENFLLILTFLCAAVEWLAVAKGWRTVEYLAKPGVMAFLFAWLWLSGGLGGPLLWFGLAILLSMAGDTFLLLKNENRWFPFGLGAFLLAHIAYIAGLNIPPAPLNTLTLGIALFVGMTVFPLIRRILRSLPKRGLRRLVEPVRYYSATISLMLFSALVTLFRTDWLDTPAYLVSLGAVLFVASDMILAWNKFVRPIRRGRLALMVTYHLGQILLVMGAVGQFG